MDGLSQTGAELYLEQGVAEVKVVHGDETTRWKVQSGPYTVHVVGTEFRVAWDVKAQVFELDMHEGEVIVEGPDFEKRSFGAGESLRVGPRSDTKVAIQADEPLAAELNDELGLGLGLGLLPSASPAAAEPVQAGKLPPARPVNRAEDFEALLTSGSIADLEVRATRARRDGDPREWRVHEAVRERFPGTRAASDAAFYLARYESRQGNRVESERWLRACLAEAPGGRWAGEATGRLVESMYESGGPRRAEARELARHYLERYPGGSHAAYARRIAAE